MLLTLKIFKVDMSFKQANTAKLNKVIIAINIPKINKGTL
jgi:hypothetical protein